MKIISQAGVVMANEDVKVLIVDDEPSIITLLTSLLSRSTEVNFILSSTVDLKSCLNMLHNNNYNAILLDLNLPDSSGLDTIKKVAKEFPRVPIVVMTGASDRQVVEGVLSAGAQDFFQKMEMHHIPLTRTIKYAIERKSIQIRESLYEKELKKEVDKRTKQLEYAKLMWERTFDGLPDLIFIVDGDYNIIRANDAMANRMGVKPTDIIGRKCYEIMHSQEEPIPECRHARTLRDKIGQNIQFKDPITDADLQLNSSPLLKADGNIIGCVEVVRDISPLKDVERALGEEVRKNQQIIDCISTPIIVKNLDGYYTACNTAYVEYFGISKEQILGKSAENIMGNMSAQEHIAIDNKALDSGTNIEYESTLFNANKDKRNVIIYKSLLKNSEGYSIGVVSAIVDITERKKVEQVLAESDKRHRMLLDQLPVSTVIYDTNGGVIFCNKAFENTFGWSMSELIGKKLDFVPDEVAEETKNKINEIRNGVTIPPFETIRYTKDKRKIFVKVQSSPYFNDSGIQVGNIVLIRDITMVKMAEAERLKTEKRYKTLVETMNEGLIVVDNMGYIIYSNPQFLRITGYTIDEVMKIHFFSLLDNESRQLFLKLWQKFGVDISESYEIGMKRKDGTVLKVLASPKTIMDDNGEFIGAFSVITDITERKSLESQLMQAQKLESVGQLAAGIAHEINTPTQYVSNNNSFVAESFQDINRLINSYRALARRLQDSDAIAEEISDIKQLEEEIDYEFLSEEIPNALAANSEGLARIATIVKSVKEFAHPGQVDKQEADINRAIENTVSVARNEWKYVADVELDLEEGLPHIPCVIGEINQVILNLLVNSAQAIGECSKYEESNKGKIKICSRLNEDYIEVVIEDNGPGIPDDIKDYIFDPFFTTKEPGKGTGQGLAISYRAIVKTHKGSIKVDSEIGKGTKFIIKLPVSSREKIQEVKP